jgi:hypothetical protein
MDLHNCASNTFGSIFILITIKNNIKILSRIQHSLKNIFNIKLNEI